MNYARRLLRLVLNGLGDTRWERLFRMNFTLNQQRGLSDQEIARLPEWWKRLPAIHIAGGPVQVYWERGVPPGLLSASPCENPGKRWLEPKIWFPIDCGKCPSCLARIEIETTGLPCTRCVPPV